jgi:hypothetical protein
VKIIRASALGPVPSDEHLDAQQYQQKWLPGFDTILILQMWSCGKSLIYGGWYWDRTSGPCRVKQGAQYARIPHHRRALAGRFAIVIMGFLPGRLRALMMMCGVSQKMG